MKNSINGEGKKVRNSRHVNNAVTRNFCQFWWCNLGRILIVKLHWQ